MKNILQAYIVVLAVATARIAVAAPAEFKAGAATSNITPDIGSRIMGGFTPIPSRHIHDDLNARCLVLDDGSKRVALVVCDLLAVHRSISREARRLIQAETGIPPENVMISATHTHSAALTEVKESPAAYDRAAWFEADIQLDSYQTFVARRIADGVRRAANQLRPAQIAFGTAEAPEFAFNRRWIMREGSIAPNPFGKPEQVKQSPPFQDPGLIRPAGERDTTISFIALREPAGRMIAVYSAFSMHYVGFGKSGEISADYYGMYCEALRRLQSSQDPDRPFVAMMANGTSGDATVWNRRDPAPKDPPFARMRMVAEALAGKVNTALQRVTWKDRADLATRYRELELAWRAIDEETLEWAKKVAATPSSTPVGVLQRSYSERVEILAAKKEPARVPIQFVRIGDVGIGSIACEIFAEIGLEFKRRSPTPHSFMVSLNHGYFGYLPTPRHYPLGGYETWPGTNYLEKEASVKLMNALLEMGAGLTAASTASN